MLFFWTGHLEELRRTDPARAALEIAQHKGHVKAEKTKELAGRLGIP
ncbi:MAG: hypothetical protein IJ840_06225 [Bacteroidales bacterium]|nr:hypothetical protein [Bacteroidales bacterium]